MFCIGRLDANAHVREERFQAFEGEAIISPRSVEMVGECKISLMQADADEWAIRDRRELSITAIRERVREPPMVMRHRFRMCPGQREMP